MPRRLSVQNELLLREAIRSGAQPFAPRGQQKLVVRAPGGKRAIALFTREGRLNPAGEYFFRQRQVEAPDRTFDQTQRPVIEGRQEKIMLKDGSMGTTRTFYSNKWKPTKLGLQFYKDKRRTYIVYFPADSKYEKEMANSRILTTWGRNERLESTGTDLGAISLPGTLDSQEAEAEVRRRVEDWVSRQPREDGHVVLARDYYRDTFLRDDWQEHLDIREEDVSVTADGQLGVEAMERRPLRAGRPWLMHNSFQWAMADEAFVETEGQCVATQMLALTSFWTHQELMQDFALSLTHCSGSPCGDWTKAGVTLAMVKWVCLKGRVPLSTLWRGKLVSKQEGVGEGLALLVDGEHAYFIKDHKMRELISKMKVQAPLNRPATVVACDKPMKRDPESAWEPLKDLSSLEPGRTYTVEEGQIEGIRADLLKERVCPSVRLCTSTKIATLVVPIRGQKDPARIVSLPSNVEDLRRMARALQEHLGRPFEYQGETQEILAHRALLELLKPPRRPRTPKRNDRCARCSDGLERRVGDHIVARSQGGPDDPSNIQDLCPDCSDEKTLEENELNVQGTNQLLSRLNRETYRLFHESRKPPQMVATLHQPEACRGAILEVDIRRCRFRALCEAQEIPSYATTDEIKPRALCELQCYNWVSACFPELTPLRALPFYGSGWYTRADCQFMLAHQIVGWHHIEYSYKPSALIGPRFSKALKTLDSLFECAAGEQAAKAAMNAMIGQWGKPTRFRFNLEATTNPEDILFEGVRQIRPTPGTEELQDVITKTRVLTYATMRPIQQLALSGERLAIARCVYIATVLCDPRALISINVDALYIQPGKRKVEKLRKLFEEMRYRDLPNVRLKFVPLSGFCSKEDEGGSEDLVFKVREKPPLLRKGTLSIQDAPPIELESLEWDVVEEPLGGPDTFYELIREQVVGRGLSCSISGPPGYGKSYILKRLKKELEDNEERVKAMAPYHVAARQLQCDATTTHSFVHRHVLGGTFKGTLLLDEVFVVSPEIVCLLEHCTLNLTRIICCGDPDQLRGIQPQWRGQPVSPQALEESRVLLRWCDGKAFRLNRYRRGDANEEFAKTFRGLRGMGGDAIKEACERFPCSDRPADWNLVLSHRERKRINRVRQAQLALQKEVKLTVKGEEGYDIFEGTKLIGCNNRHKKIKNGALLEVVSVGAIIKLRDVESLEEFGVTLEQLPKFTRLRHAMTIAACQGRTLPGIVRLWSLGSRHMSATHIYVAASRAEGPDRFEVVAPL